MSDPTPWHQAMFGTATDPQAKLEADNAKAGASWVDAMKNLGPPAVSFGDSDSAMGRAAAAKRDLRLAHAQAEAEQARLERDRIGIDIGSVPPAMQEETYRAALARLRALEAERP